MINMLFTVLKISIIEMIYLTGLIIFIGLILGLLERLSNEFIQRAMGRKGIYFTAWLGTPIHEIGHAVMCVVFKHRITKIKLLNINNESEILGYVQHSYNQNSLYERIGNLFIGLGPIFSGIASLIIGIYLLLPHSFNVFKNVVVQGIDDDKLNGNSIKVTFDAVGTLISSIFSIDNLSNPLFWIFIILAICISSHVALSKADMIGAKDGFLSLLVLLIIINLVFRFFNMDSTKYITKITRYNVHLLAYLMIALIFSGISLFLSSLCYGFAYFKKSLK